MAKTKIEKEILQWWWVALFALVCFGIWEREKFVSYRAVQNLKEQALSISDQIQTAEKTQNDLKAQIAAKNDPAWMEQVLIQRTGAIPSGTKKIIFIDHD